MRANYRVHFQPNGRVVVYDLNDNRTHYPNEEALPMWIREKVALLRMVGRWEANRGRTFPSVPA